ncbi:MAG: hypothetical protein Q4C99_01740 [Clostridia bacterium]|nr:hypothetical protein [Clostridia bacterium]
MSTGKKSKKFNTSFLLPLIVLLVILILASSAFLAAVLKGRASNEENVIALFPGDKLSAAAVDSEYAPAKIKPGFKAYDDKISWDTQTDVDLFKKAYANDNGDYSVVSGNGDKVIAPGTSNTYSFSLKNTGNVDFDYVMDLDSIFEVGDNKLPIQVRLFDGENWIAGGENSYISAENLKDYEVKGNLKVGKYVTYSLEWRWAFENDDADKRVLQNINDTVLGNRSVSADTRFDLIIKTTAEVPKGAVATDENGTPLYDKVDKNINVIYVGVPAVFILAALIGLLLLLLLRRRIYVTGFVNEGNSVQYKKNSDDVRPDGRFYFAKVISGKNKFILCSANGNRLAEFDFKINFKRNADIALDFNEKDDVTVLTVDSKVRAIEIFLDKSGDKLTVNTNKWAAVDKDHTVYNLSVSIPADDENCNTTPYGLHIDNKNKFTFVKAKEYETV